MKLPFILAKRFVAGESLEQAIPKVRQINHKNVKVTLDMLGEDVTDRVVADQMVDNYINILQSISQAGLDATISVKATMMGLTIDREYCRDNLFRLLDTAQEEDQFVRIDMEGSSHTQATIDLFREAYENYGKHVGLVIQAYLNRSREDISELAEIGADVRLCKGAYNEPKQIALQKMDDIREAYKTDAKVLLEETFYPRIATHDDKLINWTKKYTVEQNIHPSRFEFQMLYGMRQQTIEDLAQEGYNTRIYVPFGTEWFPYFRRRLTERKENIWFVLTTLFKK
jgi:proline dehydrogenase